MTSLFRTIELLGRGNPANYQKLLEPVIIISSRFMHFLKVWSTNRLEARILCKHQISQPFRS